MGKVTTVEGSDSVRSRLNALEAALGAGGTHRLDALESQTSGWVNVASYADLVSGSDWTAALQAAINAAAASGAEVRVPDRPLGTAYQFTKLYLHYDAANNPGFPSTSANVRAITLRGVGPGSDTATTGTAYIRSTLVSTDASGPAISVDGGAGYSARQIVLDGLTLVANSSGPVVKFVNANTGSQIRNCTIRQNGTGGGVDWDSPWVNSGLENVLIESGASGYTAGSYGLRIRAAVSGGQVFADRVIIQRAFGATGGFDIGVQIGALSGETAYENQILTAFSSVGLAAQFCNRGLVIGARVRGASFIGPYFEGNAQCAVNITNRCGQLSIRNGDFSSGTATDGDILIDAATAPTPLHNIEITGNHFRAIYNYGIDFVDGTNTSGRIIGNRFIKSGGGAGIGIRTRSLPTPWAVEDNVFDTSSGLTAYDDATVVARRTETDGTLYASSKIVPGKGTAGTLGIWMGAGVPSSGLGSDGDRYFQTDAPGNAYQRDYIKNAGAWISLRTEPGGAATAASPGNGSTVNPQALTTNAFVYTAGAGVTAITIGQPGGVNQGREITIAYANASGGASAATFDAAYFKASGTLAPANGFMRSATFIYQNGFWREIARTPADVPN